MVRRMEPVLAIVKVSAHEVYWLCVVFFYSKSVNGDNAWPWTVPVDVSFGTEEVLILKFVGPFSSQPPQQACPSA